MYGHTVLIGNFGPGKTKCGGFYKKITTFNLFTIFIKNLGQCVLIELSDHCIYLVCIVCTVYIVCTVCSYTQKLEFLLVYKK